MSTVVETGYGPLRGVDDGRVTAWKGVRYAAPPIGDLRWRAPQPPEPWRQVADATARAGMSRLLSARVALQEDFYIRLPSRRPAQVLRRMNLIVSRPVQRLMASLLRFKQLPRPPSSVS